MALQELLRVLSWGGSHDLLHREHPGLRHQAVPTGPSRWTGENQTSESVILRPGDIVMSAHAEGDGGEARCRLCRYSDGTCAVGFRKVHDRQTSRGNVPIARAKKQPGEVTSRSRTQQPGETTTSSRANSVRPLSEMAGFKTRRGLMLLYDPTPDDVWINRPIARIRGGWKDTSTGEVLSKTQAQAYSKFPRRHLDRNKVGDIADKLVRMVDKYLPLQADETRAYVCRFPEQAESLLKRVKKIRKRLCASKEGRCTTTTRSSTTAKGSKAKKRRVQPRGEE